MGHATTTSTPPLSADTPLHALRWQALGTECFVQYAGASRSAGRDFEHAAQRWVEAFEAKYSRFRPDSLISRINAAAGRDWVETDEEMESFLNLSGSLHSMSRGLLDVTALPLLRLWDYKSATPRIPAESEIAAAQRLVGWPRVERRARSHPAPAGRHGAGLRRLGQGIRGRHRGGDRARARARERAR